MGDPRQQQYRAVKFCAVGLHPLKGELGKSCGVKLFKPCRDFKHDGGEFRPSGLDGLWVCADAGSDLAPRDIEGIPNNAEGGRIEGSARKYNASFHGQIPCHAPSSVRVLYQMAETHVITGW